MTSPDLVPIRRALLSVYDKTGLEALATFLSERGVELVSTGGTAAALRKAGLKVRDVSEVTGFPEIMDGRVKTLHPMIHGGLLGRRDAAAHVRAMEQHGIPAIDLLVSNLYPFEQTVKQGGTFEDCIENIDIGGPAQIRAASKNHDFVTVLTDPQDYGQVIEEMRANNGATTLALRRRLAGAAYARTASYDAAIAAWFAQQRGDAFPARLSIPGELRQTLRYGENPHQVAAFYTGALTPGDRARPGLASARQVQGKELSYNNLNDTDAAFELVAEFDRPAIAIIKHANPCGVAEGDALADAYQRAFDCDPVSAFGGIVAANRMLDAATAEKIARIFVEVIIAPDADADAQRILAAKPNLRLLLAGGVPDPAASGFTFRSLAGGMLIQTRDNGRVAAGDLKVMTRRAPGSQELSDLLFAWRVCKHTKSNAIVYARGGATTGIGAGQMSRVDAARIGAIKAADVAKAAGRSQSGTVGSVAASDAFFPFPDGLVAAAEAGATAFIQPGGSMRDAEVVAEADKRGLAMVATGMRHFRH
ncbi:MAG: bifunctional phosphoribosylaminoimidazolecarboxamide formyltransferase/IMP cyclohydrolase [Alphaproteobacteria bacterium]|nr:bifunctional phosphoribosylaminoimidazolecarboxamide formyltransferase/IMP cyclohydrolase [Alphaproteobacteria bacterium]